MLWQGGCVTDPKLDVRRTGTRGRNRLTWLVAGAALVLLAAAAAYALLGGDDAGTPATTPHPEPAATTLQIPPAAGRCMVPSAEVLAGSDLAIEGTVTGVAGGVVTLAVDRVYAGADRAEVTVAAPSSGPAELDQGVELVTGRRYLLAANGDQVMVCGFSGEATPQLAELYAQAFPE